MTYSLEQQKKIGQLFTELVNQLPTNLNSAVIRGVYITSHNTRSVIVSVRYPELDKNQNYDIDLVADFENEEYFVLTTMYENEKSVPGNSFKANNLLDTLNYINLHVELLQNNKLEQYILSIHTRLVADKVIKDFIEKIEESTTILTIYDFDNVDDFLASNIETDIQLASVGTHQTFMKISRWKDVFKIVVDLYDERNELLSVPAIVKSEQDLNMFMSYVIKALRSARFEKYADDLEKAI